LEAPIAADIPNTLAHCAGAPNNACPVLVAPSSWSRFAWIKKDKKRRNNPRKKKKSKREDQAVRGTRLIHAKNSVWSSLSFAPSQETTIERDFDGGFVHTLLF
jgi:hypothetical protein